MRSRPGALLVKKAGYNEYLPSCDVQNKERSCAETRGKAMGNKVESAQENEEDMMDFGKLEVSWWGWSRRRKQSSMCQSCNF